MKRIIASGDPSEYDGPGLPEAKNRATTGAIVGSLVGGIVFYLLFAIPGLIIESQNYMLLVGCATVGGSVLGACVGILTSLRSWHLKWGSRILPPTRSLMKIRMNPRLNPRKPASSTRDLNNRFN